MTPRTRSIFGLAMLLATSALFAEEGIPPAEWTRQEQDMVRQMRVLYEKQGLPFTDEQAATAVKTMRDKLARVTGQIAALQAGVNTMPVAGAAMANGAPAQQPQSVGAQSESDLALRYAQIPAMPAGVQLEGRQDGFVVNGRPFIDPEGTIEDYALDVTTGNVGYIAQSPAGKVVKVTRAGTDAEPIRIATLAEAGSGWQVTTVTGKTIAGDRYTLTPTGVLVSRSTAALLYETGKDLATFAVPHGYVMAEHQRGDVAGTGYALLETARSPASASSGENPLATLKSIGLPFGRKEDYALVNLSSGKLYSLDIPLYGKDVRVGSDCKRVNDLINKCATSTRHESLYNTAGRPNQGHYYWRVMWMNTPAGPLAIALENDLADLNLLDLTTGKKVTAVSRRMGIAGFTASQNADGTVSISARVGFSNKDIHDAAALLRSDEEQTPSTSTP